MEVAEVVAEVEAEAEEEEEEDGGWRKRQFQD